MNKAYDKGTKEIEVRVEIQFSILPLTQNFTLVLMKMA